MASAATASIGQTSTATITGTASQESSFEVRGHARHSVRQIRKNGTSATGMSPACEFCDSTNMPTPRTMRLPKILSAGARPRRHSHTTNITTTA